VIGTHGGEEYVKMNLKEIELEELDGSSAG
jgi:hypothetical protein